MEVEAAGDKQRAPAQLPHPQRLVAEEVVGVIHQPGQGARPFSRIKGIGGLPTAGHQVELGCYQELGETNRGSQARLAEQVEGLLASQAFIADINIVDRPVHRHPRLALAAPVPDGLGTGYRRGTQEGLYRIETAPAYVYPASDRVYCNVGALVKGVRLADWLRRGPGISTVGGVAEHDL